MFLLYPSPLENIKLLYKKPHGNKGIPKSKESTEKNRQKHLEKKHKPESIEKTRKANLKNKNALGIKHTPEQNEAKRKARLGIKQSEESKLKNSKTHKELCRLNPEIINKMIQTHFHIFSSLDKFLKDKYCPLFNDNLKESVRERDSHTCQNCGKIWIRGERKFPPHHIHHDKKNCFPDLILLCTSCNARVNKKSLRNYYEFLFMNKLNDRQLLFWTKNRRK